MGGGARDGAGGDAAAHARRGGALPAAWATWSWASRTRWPRRRSASWPPSTRRGCGCASWVRARCASSSRTTSPSSRPTRRSTGWPAICTSSTCAGRWSCGARAAAAGDTGPAPACHRTGRPARCRPCLTTALHDRVTLDPVERAVVTLLDGTREAPDILGEVVRRAAGDYMVEADGKPITQSDLLLPNLLRRVNRTVERLAAWGLLQG